MQMHPYKNESLNSIYDLLFCDDLEAFRTAHQGDPVYPWTTLFNASSSTEELEGIIEDAGTESRQKLLAARLLAHGKPLPVKRVFGVVIEVGMDQGLDVLAAYEDGTARYINYSEKVIVWETRTTKSGELIADLLQAARNVVEQIGPWDKQRLAPPATGNVRMSFLVSNGLYFGEGPFEALMGDPIGGPVINSGAQLMKFLVENSLQSA